MFEDLPLFPVPASTFAGQVDALYFFLVAMATFFVLLIFGTVIYFTAKYRRRSATERPPPIHIDMRLEILWSIIPLILVMISFGWGGQPVRAYVPSPGRRFGTARGGAAMDVEAATSKRRPGD